MDFYNDKDNNFERPRDFSEEDDNENPSKYYVTPPSPTYYKEKKRRPLFTILIFSLISALIGGIIGAYIGPTYLYGSYSKGGVNPPQNVEIITKGEEMNMVPAVVKKAMPSVVGITTVTLEKDFFLGVRKGQGVGTGVIIDSRGYILTNSHVVNDGQTEEVRILFYDGTDGKANVLWNDSLLDLAIVKVQKENLPVASLGDSDKLTVGQLAVAIGNPLGLSFERTVTSGIISGLERSIPVSEFESIEGLIQTDASINPGNSGGPLLNNKGEVIGINTVKIQSGEGLGFAIPINIAKPIVDEFIEKGEFKKGYLGIKGINAAQYVRTYGNNIGTEKGIFIYQIYANSPVEKAGMKEGDVILSINNNPVDTMGQLVRQLYKYRPGDTLEIEVLRNGKKLKLKTVLEAAPRE